MIEKWTDVIGKVLKKAILEYLTPMGRINLIFVVVLFGFALAFHLIESIKQAVCAFTEAPAESSVGPFFWWTVLIVAVGSFVLVLWCYQPKRN